MRVFLLVLLIALTPLRSWAADAMAIQMGVQSTAQETGPAQALPQVHPDDCMESQQASSGASDHCATCAACQTCFTVALVSSAHRITAQPALHHLPTWASAFFTSAEPALGQKPPIS
jgi:hypothetical protein